jgi:hypothetical protein
MSVITFLNIMAVNVKYIYFTPFNGGSMHHCKNIHKLKHQDLFKQVGSRIK